MLLSGKQFSVSETNKTVCLLDVMNLGGANYSLVKNVSIP